MSASGIFACCSQTKKMLRQDGVQDLEAALLELHATCTNRQRMPLLPLLDGKGRTCWRVPAEIVIARLVVQRRTETP